MEISACVKYVGVNDHQVDLFEGQYKVPNGMSYNSYVILDDKIAVMDTVDRRATEPWLENLSAALAGRTPDYLVIQHLEPDHAGSIGALTERYPEMTLVASAKALANGAAAIAPTAFDWAGLLLISFVLPAVLCWLFGLFFRKIGWIKEGDLKLD